MKRKYLAAGIALSVLSNATFAAEVNWSGFLSVVGGQTMDEGNAYNVGFLGYTAAYDDELSYAPDSLIGLQAQAVVSDRLRATVQMVGRGGNDFDIDAEWAYLSYDLTDNITANAGKFRMPLFYYSDFLDIGYAYYWIRPPANLYSGPSSLTGVNIYFQNYIGDYELSGQVFSGNTDAFVGGGVALVDIEVNGGITLQVSKDWWKIRGLFQTNEATTSATIPGLFPDNTEEFEFSAVSFVVDKNDFMLRSEYTVLGNKTTGDNSDKWFVSSGYRLGDFTPHVTFTAVDARTGFELESEEITVGLAWNFDPSAVFKVEYSSRDHEDDAFDDIDLVSVGIDLLF